MRSDLLDVKTYYTSATSTENTGLIPKRVMQTWKTSVLDRPHATRLINFRNKYPNFSFEFYDDSDMDEYMHARWSKHPIFAVYVNSLWGASKADIWRYCILYDKGGIYLDIDSSIEFDLNKIPDDAAELISFEPRTLKNALFDHRQPGLEYFAHWNFRQPSLEVPENIVLQWCLIFKPQHQIMKTVIELIVQQAEFYRNRTVPSVHHAVLGLAGPVVFSQAVWRYAERGHPLYQCGIDFRGQATFKNIPDDNGVYAKAAVSGYSGKRDGRVLADAVRLNLRCGDDLKCGYINIDLYASGDFVTRMDLRNLDFADNSVDEIYARDVLEHFGLPDAMQCLKNWARVLKPGGTLMVQTPCLTLMAEALANGHLGLEQINYFLFSGVRQVDGRAEWCTPAVREDDWHKSVYTEGFLSQVLAANGLEVVTMVLDTPGRGPRAATNIKVIARKTPPT